LYQYKMDIHIEQIVVKGRGTAPVEVLQEKCGQGNENKKKKQH